MIYSTPLEQFEIISILPLFHFKNIYLNITNSNLFTFLNLSFMLLLFQFINMNNKVIPTTWQSVLEEVFLFTKTLLEKNIGPQSLEYFPFIFFLFSFLTISNLIGMIPYSFTITSHIFITFSLALTLFIGINLIAIKKHKLHFLGFFHQVEYT